MHFFCTKKQYREWLATGSEEKEGYLLDAVGGLDVARQIFGMGEDLQPSLESAEGRNRV